MVLIRQKLSVAFWTACVWEAWKLRMPLAFWPGKAIYHKKVMLQVDTIL